MKKRLLALLLCAIMVVGTLPVTPLTEFSSMQAVAADIETLQSVFNSVPDKSTWDQYVDTSALKVAYEYAALLLDKHENFDQSEIDACTNSLRDAIAGLKYHTLGIALNKTTHTASVGESFVLKAILEPADAADEVVWKSSDATVASVTQSGAVTVNKYTSKKVTITATSNGHSASCELTVLNPLGGVKLSRSSADLYEGKSITLTATAYGADQNNLPTGNVIYTWSSDDVSVAKVTDQGVVTAVSEGSCNISVTATDNSNIYTAKCKITVNKLVQVSSLQPITVTTSGSLVMTVNESLLFRVTVLPSNASEKELVWSSSDSSIATVGNVTVSDSGIASAKITARKEGKTKITYKTTDGSGLSGSFYVDVRPLITAVALSPASKVITLDSIGEKFTAVITPENAGNQVLSWSSDNPLVCEVDYNGTLVPHAPGVCNISAATSDGSNIVVTGKVRVAAKAANVTISKSTLTLNTGKTYTLAASVTTLDGEVYDDVKWASSDSSVATVNQNGVVTAKYPGQAVITATALDSSGKNAVCVVTVNQPVTGVELQATKAIYVGSSATLTPTIVPSYATNQKVTWESSKPEIATVSSTGKITGKSAGKTTVTCTTEDGGFTASCTVTVLIKTEGVTLNYTSAKLWKGNTLQLVPTIVPEDATNKNVTWSSDDTTVATVSSTGLVTAVAGGTAKITVKTNNSGKTASCTITVLENCTGVRLESDTMRLYIGQNYQIKADVLPLTATNKEVTWSSDDKSVVKVSSTGLLTAVSAGSATITVKTVNGGFTDTCLVTVHDKVPVTGISLDTTSLKIAVNEYYTFLATVKPSNASERGVIWSSSNSKVVVNQNGLIKAKSTGTAIITATTVDGNYQAQCKVTVVQPVTGVRISATSVTLAAGKSKALTANVFPENATNQKITWKSSDTKVATVDSKGLVTAKSAGTAAISVTTADGGYTSTCNVTVYVPVTGVKLGATTLKLAKGETRLVTANVLPSNATNQGITWSSSNTAIATVNEAGQITAKSKGTVNIKATSKDGGFSATCVVEVLQLASSVKLNYTSITLDVGKYKTFTATITPSTVSYPSVVWKTSNSKVVAINTKGLIKGVSAGTATITCTTKDGNAKTTCKVTVVQPATGLKLSTTAMKVREGSVKAITATVLPADTTNAKVTWSSSNTSIATVDSNGVVKGIAPGYVKITAKTVTGGQSESCTVRVIRSVTGIKLNKTDLTINVGKKSVITPTVLPHDASIKTVKWTSSNYDVADVTGGGEVIAKAPGYAVITATTTDKSFKATCNVLVIQPVTGVSLNKTSLLVEAGEKYSLAATVKPSNASDKSLKWSSSDKTVAKVSTTGVVTGVKSGTATITCTTVSGGFKATCKVQVVKKVTGISINKTSATLYLGKQLNLNETVTPEDATVKTVKWYSGNKEIATVNSTGVVTPVKPGTVTIGVRTTDGSFKAYCQITVKRAVESIKLDKSSLTIYTGEYYTFTPTILPSNATDKTLTWTTSNSSVLAVNQKGLIKGKTAGTAVITAKTENGLKYSCTVTVRQSVTDVALNYDTANVYAGETLKLSSTVFPENAYNKAVKWSSSNSAVAKVSTTGVVTGVKAGTATITVTTSDGAKTASCDINVLQHVTSIAFEKSALSMRKGDEADLVVKVYPDNATDKTYTFESSDAETVFVSATGHIIAKRGGEAVITVTSTENNKSATCRITVIEPVTAVALDKQENTIFVGESFTLGVVISPSDANNKSVMWTSSDPSVATVSSKGVVTAMKSGTTTITVKTNDGDFTDYCEVTCLQKPVSVELDVTKTTVNTGEQLTLKATVLPEDSYNKDVTWHSSNESIATVDGGVVTAINPGQVTITVKTVEGEKQAVCELTVHQPVQRIELDKTDITVNRYLTQQLSAVVYPSNASNQAISWSSSDITVATVANGLVRAEGKGTAYITATSDDTGVTAVCKVTVRQQPEEITFPESEFTVFAGEKGQLVWTVLPENSNDMSVSFESGDEEIFTVDANGVITGLKAGSAELTVTATDGGVQGRIGVIVIQKAEEVIITDNIPVIWMGESFRAEAAVLPADTTDKKVIWSSDDESVATVDENGLITAVGVGVCDITAASVYGTAEDTVTVEIRQRSEEITFGKTEFTICTGEREQLIWSVLPESTSDKAVSFESGDEEIFTVDENGVITGVKAGAAAVTVTAKDGGATATVTVIVIQKAEEIIIKENVPVLWVGESFSAEAAVLPVDTTDKKVIWSSDNENVATVDENGVITAVGAGVCGVTAASVYGTAEDTVSIEVRQQVTGITISRTEKAMNLDDVFTLTATVLPENAYDKSVTWLSSDSEIAAVDENGVVTAKKTGTAIITAVSSDDTIKAECAVRVIRLIDSIIINEAPVVLEKGETKQLTVTILPENATEKQLTWSSDNEAVVTVDENGVLTAVAGGKATVRVDTTTDDVYAVCEVTVDVRSTAISLDKNTAEVYCGDTLELEAVFTPADTTNKNIIWTVDDDTVATVTDGIVTPLKVGTVTVTATTEDTSVSDSCVVTVLRHVENVNILSDEKIFEKGTSAALKSEVLPEDATNKKLIWTSSDEAVVKVTDGVVEAVSVGNATVTAESEDGAIKDSCSITVIQKPTQIILDATEITLVEGDSKTLTATLEPSDTTETELEWLSADDDIAMVDENGNVTAVSKGETEITAVSKANGSVYAKCTVTVTRAVQSIKIETARKTAYVGRPFTVEVVFTPADATNQNLTWKTSDKKVATVDYGVVTPVGKGSAIITAESEDGGYVAYCFVNVLTGIDSVAFEETEISLNKKESYEIGVIILPDDVSSRELIWTTDNDKVATVENGVVTAGETAGTAIIRGTAPDNAQAYAECKVTVIENVISVTLDETELEMKAGDERQLTATVMPSNATDRSVIWHSTDSKVAAVDENGVVTAITAGTANIVCTTVDSGLTAICSVKVFRELDSLTISLPAISMKNGTSLPLTITTDPDNHDEKLSFASLNEDVVVVSADGVVTAKGPGKATVVAISNVSGTRAECEVTVIQSVEAISFASPVFTDAYTGLSHSLSYTVMPENASDKSVRWLSSDESIATISPAGLITYHSAGEVVITVQSLESEVYAQCTVTVRQAPEEVYLDMGAAELSVGAVLELEATVGPASSFDTTVYWRSDNKDVVHVDGNGKITALSKGTAIVTVTTWNGHEASCMIEVK